MLKVLLDADIDEGIPCSYSEREKAEGYKIQPKKDGSALVQLPALTESDAIRFVLGGLGAVRIVKLETLRKRLLAFTRDIQKING